MNPTFNYFLGDGSEITLTMVDKILGFFKAAEDKQYVICDTVSIEMLNILKIKKMTSTSNESAVVITDENSDILYLVDNRLILTDQHTGDNEILFNVSVKNKKNSVHYKEMIDIALNFKQKYKESVVTEQQDYIRRIKDEAKRQMNESKEASVTVVKTDETLTHTLSVNIDNLKKEHCIDDETVDAMANEIKKDIQNG